MKSYIFLFSLIVLTGCAEKHPPAPRPHVVKVVTATKCAVPLFQNYVGHLEANISVAVMPQVSGILVGQHFVEGADVKKGDLLLTIDPRPYEADLAKAHAALMQAEASLEFAEEKTARYAKLLEEEFVSKLDYDQYQTNVLTGSAQVEQSAADLWTAQINLGYCYIRAPMDCTTGVLQIKPGNYVDSTAGTSLTLLNQIQPILVNFTIPEDDLLILQMAQKDHPLKLEVSVDQERSKTFDGVLTLIDNQVNAGTGAVLCQGTIQNEEKLLWPGHFVDVRVILKEESEEMVIPTKAVMIGQAGNYVYLVDSDQKISLAPVTIGERYKEYTVISKGLKENDLVVLDGQLNLYPGLKVEIAGSIGTTYEH